MSEKPQVSNLVPVPYLDLSENTLHGVLEAFVLREGTDYGSQEYSLEQKVEQVMQQLKRAEVSIVFNIEDESFDIRKVSTS